MNQDRESIEAIQFRDWRPWHAIRPDAARTVCGLSPLGAKRMWEKWNEQIDRCKTSPRPDGGTPSDQGLRSPCREVPA